MLAACAYYPVIPHLNISVFLHKGEEFIRSSFQIVSGDCFFFSPAVPDQPKVVEVVVKVDAV